MAELRVLNLADNRLTELSGLQGLYSLAELNARKNQIQRVVGADVAQNLERLYLSHNDITHLSDAASILDVPYLAELTLDNNPISKDPFYRELWIENIKTLRAFDNKRVSDDERRMAVGCGPPPPLPSPRTHPRLCLCLSPPQGIMLRKEDEKKREAERAAQAKLNRAATIIAAEEAWRAAHARESSLAPAPGAARPGSAFVSPTSSSAQLSRTLSAGPRRLSLALQGRDTTTNDDDNSSDARQPRLAEVVDDTLHIYGPAFDELDRNWSSAVSVVAFHFVDFDLVAPHLSKLRHRTPGADTLHLSCTNLCRLEQLNALGAVKRLVNLVIDKDEVRGWGRGTKLNNF